MTWVDTHCHLQLDGRDPAELLGRAVEVDWVVAPGIDAASSAASIHLARMHPDRILPTAGLHPHEAGRWKADSGLIEGMVRDVCAIGETGLDFYRMLSPERDQVAAFEGQIELANVFDKPLIVHCRDAFSAIHDILDKTGSGDRAVLHSWTGGTKWTRRFLDLGVTFSYSGIVAFETGETIRLGAALVPPERAMVETDTPYLAPPPHRGKSNEPAWVKYVGATLARIWGLPIEEVAEKTSSNATRIFRP